MKKFFTILCFAPMVLFAQMEQRVDMRAVKEANAARARDIQSPLVNKLRSAPMRKTNGDAPLYGAITIGMTQYDLQSNSAVAPRLQVYPGGKITAAWTTSTEGTTSGYADRGTGYNQSVGGTTWRKALPNKARFESSRVGWPNIGVATFGGTEKEYVFAHAVATSGLTGGFVFSTNTGIGTDFTAGGTVLNDTYNAANTPGPIWARSATAGTKIVLISCFADSTQNYPKNQYLGGVKRPITYSVYDATGQTWITKNTLLPGYDSVRYDVGQADDYAIDASGNKVRIVIGGLGDDLALWKSDDAGANWTKIIIDSAKTALPTPRSKAKNINNGAVSVVIDNQGVTHIAYAMLGLSYDSITATDTLGYTTYGTGIEGIIYWNDKINSTTGKFNPTQKIGHTPDQDGDNLITLAANSRSRSYGGYGQALQFVTNGPTYCALSNQPMLSYDGNGNIFCTYIAPVELDVDVDEENFNDIFVVYSKDTGKTWSDAQNLTKTEGFEEFFPTLAKVSDSKLRLMYFLKDDVGISVSNSDKNTEQEVRVNYMEIPVSKILNDSIGKFPNGINPNIADAGFKVSQNYPNPFKGVTQIDFNINRTSDITFTVTDLLGKVLYIENKTNAEAGKHSIYFNSGSLSKGVYFYTVNNGSQKSTQKMIVE